MFETKLRRTPWKSHILSFASLLVGLGLLAVLAGCGGTTLSESEILSKLESAGLTIERLDENLITNQERARLEHEPQQMFSVRVSDGEGHIQSMTLIEFDKDWKAAAVSQEGINGLLVHNWFFIGRLGPEIQSKIEAAFL